MSTVAALAGCLGALAALGVAERRARDAARRAVPIRVHVNGTRGKSTVTRMIWAALLEAGIPTIAKTTGTAPRLLMPDRTEAPIRRRAPASIREQLWLLRQARRVRARAVVAECMAIDPALQWVAEHDMIGATVGVITNVRTDHLESMGSSLEVIAESLANTIPRGGLLVLGDSGFSDRFASRAAALGTRVVVVAGRSRGVSGSSDPSAGRSGDEYMRDDEATALAVCRELGIDQELAQRGIRRAPPDPGAATEGILALPGRSVRWVDATAVNDPESFDLLGCDPDPIASSLIVFNHRADRPMRLEAFAAISRRFRAAARILIAGDRPAWTSRRLLANRCPGLELEAVGLGRLATALAAVLTTGEPEIGRVVFAGNTKGLDVARTLAEVGAIVSRGPKGEVGGVHP